MSGSSKVRIDAPMNELSTSDTGHPSDAWKDYYRRIADGLEEALAKQGTTKADDAEAGQLGEFIWSKVNAPGVTLGSGTASIVTNINLTAGDWDVRGECWFDIGTSAATGLQAAVSLFTSLGGDLARGNQSFTHPANSDQVLAMTPARLSLASTTAVNLLGWATFPGGTVTAYGRLEARRVR